MAAVPMKDLTTAKQRLAGMLDGAERAALARAMIIDVASTLAAAPVDRVWVVTGDSEVAALAHRFAFEVVAEPTNLGHTAAVASAQRQAVELGAAVFVTIPGDVPCVTAAEIGVLVEHASLEPAAVFVPSRSGQGTNGVALAPPDAMPLTFGEPSFENHLATAHTRGLSPVVLPLSGLALDVDGPEDLAALLDEAPNTETGRLLHRLNVAGRLAARAASGG